MKKDIDKLMKKMKVDAIYAVGKSSKDATMYYLLNGANIYGHYIKKQGKDSSPLSYTPSERQRCNAQEDGKTIYNGVF